jgi:hypothetical protein
MNLIPEPYKLLAELAMVGAAVAGIGFIGARLEHNSMQVKLDAVQHAWDAERAQESAAALKATQEARAEEQRRTVATQEVVKHAQAQTVVVAAAAGRALDALARLRQRAAAVAASGGVPGDSSAPSRGASAAGPGLVLADVLGRMGEDGGRVAAYADRARVAGDACERWADALTK